MKESKGITLIALVITIIVLLILAGVSLRFIAGNEGILGRSERAVSKNEEANAREKLELELQGLLIAKKSGENFDLNIELENKGFTVSDDTVIVDGYLFTIDRENLKIVSSLGKGKENLEIKINAIVTNSQDNLKSTISATINYTGGIASVTMNGKEMQEENGTYSLEVTKNGKYTIFVKDNNNGYKMETVEVSGLLSYVDEIWNVAQLIQFRDSVNAGLNYEGRTVILKSDLDLEEIENWTPIGYVNESGSAQFSGTFEGNNHTITNLKIQNERGFFCEIVGGTVKNLNFEKVNISSNQQFTGVVVGQLFGTFENVNVRSGNLILNGGYSGGIAGAVTFGTMVRCTNEATISSTEGAVGGITGQLCRNY